MKTDKISVLAIFAFSYIIICFFIYFFDIGKTDVGKYFVRVMSHCVPSIPATAALTKDSESNGVILSISWMLPFPIWVLMSISKGWKNANIDIYRKIASPLVLFILFCASFLFIYALVNFDPSMSNKNGIRSGFLMVVLRDIRYSIIFYSFMVMFLVISIINFLFSIPISIFRKKFTFGR